ncbi:hypothetical protein KJ359_001860 [Pestalotiopsis sp. 9143b]|nr:hypothetical protein KJ359_001860 [Pestalotiopsis sp. 9143b]
MEEPPTASGPLAPLRRASTTLFNANPQLGMWQATGTALAHVPDVTELRSAETGGSIGFNAQGQSVRTAVQRDDGELVPMLSKTATSPQVLADPADGGMTPVVRRQTLLEMRDSEPKAGWGQTIRHGLQAYWKFLKTPMGIFITIYFLNIVAWGAMLFFLLLKAAPAMNYPTADDDNSPRKKWLEIDSQILNALFCVTGFGLAPWRFRDFYWFLRVIFSRNKAAMQKLAAQNSGWFRPPAWYHGQEGTGNGAAARTSSDDVVPAMVKRPTFTGERAPPTALWKLGLTIFMMVLNTAFQVVLSYYMWAYNRIDRPTWATGTFIGLGCGVSAIAGLVSWWEGRKVKKIEGPDVVVINEGEV